MSAEVKTYGLLAEYENPAQVFHACEQVRDAGFQKWDAYTPFPVHGLDGAMGLKRSPLPWVVLVMGLTGSSLAMTLQWWIHNVEYPLVISGKPLFSWQAFVPVTFELGILFASFGAVFGMLGLNRLPQFFHSLFKAPRFKRVTDDKFFIAIESIDPSYDAEKTRKLLEASGAVSVEEVEE